MVARPVITRSTWTTWREYPVVVKPLCQTFETTLNDAGPQLISTGHEPPIAIVLSPQDG